MGNTVQSMIIYPEVEVSGGVYIQAQVGGLDPITQNGPDNRCSQLEHDLHGMARAKRKSGYFQSNIKK